MSRYDELVDKIIGLNFPLFSSLTSFINSKDLLWSINSKYNKQTLTNRTYMDSANGELMLTVPIKHSGKNQPRVYSDIKLDLSSDWKKNHFKSIRMGPMGANSYPRLRGI